MRIESNFNLKEHNTFGIDAKAERFVEYASEAELINFLQDLKPPYMHIGAGSNLLFMDDYHGTVLHSAIKGVRIVDDTTDTVSVRVGAGEVWDDFVAWAVDHAYGGVENLSNIPGEVGASAVQNIGAYGVEAKDVIAEVELVDLADGSKHTVANADCHYAYRQSIFKNEWKGRYAVTYVTYTLSKHPTLKLDYGNIHAMLANVDNPTVADVRRVIIDIRNAKLPDPKIVGNAGSFFMNPVVSEDKFKEILSRFPDAPHYVVEGGVKVPAGWMIEKCGWKGRSLGKAGVHSKQALVLVNNGGASGEDVMRLSEAICKDVLETFGVSIHPEVNVV